MKKILLLGGSTQQIPAIKYAKNQGLYTILCDYLPDNPGQFVADKFYLKSTTDKEAILEVAQEERINGIVAYASDPAAPTAAYVAEKLGLPTNPYESVEILSLKDRFREFLATNGFNAPKAAGVSSYAQMVNVISQFSFPIMVKPVDSSGSKGVTKVENEKDLEEAYHIAVKYSRSKRVVIEEYIVMDHPYMIGGDCFVIDGEVKFWGFLNSHRDPTVNPLVPIGTSHPLAVSEKRKLLAKKVINKLVSSLNIRNGAFNLEIMFDNKDWPFVIEMGPRNGGNMIPDLLEHITGIDLIGATVDASMGTLHSDLQYDDKESFLSTYVLHSSKNGVLKEITYSKEFATYITSEVLYKKPGDQVEYFDGANKAIGILFMKFTNKKEMLHFMDKANEHVNILVE